MKLIIYKSDGIYCVTNEKNYNAIIRNAREIQLMKDFASPKEIIDYYCAYCYCGFDDFKMTKEVADEFIMEFGYSPKDLIQQLDVEKLTAGEILDLMAHQKAIANLLNGGI